MQSDASIIRTMSNKISFSRVPPHGCHSVIGTPKIRERRNRIGSRGVPEVDGSVARGRDKFRVGPVMVADDSISIMRVSAEEESE